MTEDVLAQARDKMRQYGIVDSGDAVTAGPGVNDRPAMGRPLPGGQRRWRLSSKTLDYKAAYMALAFLPKTP